MIARMIMPMLVLAGTAAASLAVAHAQSAPDGAKIYTRCAACHTANGAGVPGAFPPLGADFRARAATANGRRYLALAVIKGLMGPITISGRTYNGVMPAQTLDDASVAAVLNHVGTRIAITGPRFRPYTAAEVATIRAGGASLNAAAVARLHPSASAR